MSDGNYFYCATSYLITGDQCNHNSIRQSIVNLIESRGTVLNVLVDKKFFNFDNYISKLRTLGDYENVGEETALATAKLFNREVRIYCTLSGPRISTIFKCNPPRTFKNCVL